MRSEDRVDKSRHVPELAAELLGAPDLDLEVALILVLKVRKLFDDESVGFGSSGCHDDKPVRIEASRLVGVSGRARWSGVLLDGGT
jgi:hypothetical protein